MNHITRDKSCDFYNSVDIVEINTLPKSNKKKSRSSVIFRAIGSIFGIKDKSNGISPLMDQIVNSNRHRLLSSEDMKSVMETADIVRYIASTTSRSKSSHENTSLILSPPKTVLTKPTLPSIPYNSSTITFRMTKMRKSDVLRQECAENECPKPKRFIPMTPEELTYDPNPIVEQGSSYTYSLNNIIITGDDLSTVDPSDYEKRFSNNRFISIYGAELNVEILYALRKADVVFFKECYGSIGAHDVAYYLRHVKLLALESTRLDAKGCYNYRKLPLVKIPYIFVGKDAHVDFKYDAMYYNNANNPSHIWMQHKKKGSLNLIIKKCSPKTDHYRMCPPTATIVNKDFLSSYKTYIGFVDNYSEYFRGVIVPSDDDDTKKARAVLSKDEKTSRLKKISSGGFADKDNAIASPKKSRKKKIRQTNDALILNALKDYSKNT